MNLSLRALATIRHLTYDACEDDVGVSVEFALKFALRFALKFVIAPAGSRQPLAYRQLNGLENTHHGARPMVASAMPLVSERELRISEATRARTFTKQEHGAVPHSRRSRRAL